MDLKQCRQVAGTNSCLVLVTLDPCLSDVLVCILFLVSSLQSSSSASDPDLFHHHHPLCPFTPTKACDRVVWLQKPYLSLFIYWKSSELSRLVNAHIISVLIVFRAAELLLLWITGERKRRVKDPGQRGLNNRWVSSNVFCPSCWITASLVFNKTRKKMCNVEKNSRKKRGKILHV